MIEISNLVKRYGQKRAVDGISFTVNKGEVLGFLGPNGAGKSTTMNIITGYLSSTSGTVKINGHDILEEPELAKKSIGYLPEIPPLYLDMTVMEYLNFIADIKGVSRKERVSQLARILSLVKIVDVADRLIGNLSKGYRQRVGIAQAMIGDPEILILDEPTVGLDPNQILEIRKLIKLLAKTHTIIISSHILSEIQATCDRVVIINKGKVAAVSSISSLSVKLGDSIKIRLSYVGDEKAVVNSLRTISGITSVIPQVLKDDSYKQVEVTVVGDRDVRTAIFYNMANINCPIIDMRTLDASLEDVFLSITN